MFSLPLRWHRLTDFFLALSGLLDQGSFTPMCSQFPNPRVASGPSWISRWRMSSFRLQNSTCDQTGLSSPYFTRKASFFCCGSPALSVNSPGIQAFTFTCLVFTRVLAPLLALLSSHGFPPLSWHPPQLGKSFLPVFWKISLTAYLAKEESWAPCPCRRFECQRHLFSWSTSQLFSWIVCLCLIGPTYWRVIQLKFRWKIPQQWHASTIREGSRSCPGQSFMFHSTLIDLRSCYVI